MIFVVLHYYSINSPKLQKIQNSKNAQAVHDLGLANKPLNRFKCWLCLGFSFWLSIHFAAKTLKSRKYISRRLDYAATFQQMTPT
jgi:hypothetical protein